MTGLLIVILILVLSTVFGLWRRHVDGKVRKVENTTLLRTLETGETVSNNVSETLLGESLGSQATFVQFSSKICGTCHQTRATILDVIGGMPGVKLVEISVETGLGLWDTRFNIRRTPTVLILDVGGVVRVRAVGGMRKEDVFNGLTMVLSSNGVAND